MIDRRITWKGFEHASLENCMVRVLPDSFRTSSLIIGTFEGKPFQIEYQIETSPTWQTRSFEISKTLQNHTSKIIYYKDKSGDWYSEGKKHAELSGCIDIDITATPFTNTLSIKRLNLITGQPQMINVVYVDIIENSVGPEKQRYERLTDSRIKFNQISTGFEAIINIDDLGFVTSYPELFEQLTSY